MRVSRTLADLRREALEKWLAARAGDKWGPKLATPTAGRLWRFAIGAGRRIGSPPIPLPPFAKANENADRRRQHRAMTEAELSRLLTVARERPLAEALTVRRGPRKGEQYADVRPEVRDRLDLLGRERALIYKTLVLTGLRKGELACLDRGSIAP